MLTEISGQKSIPNILKPKKYGPPVGVCLQQPNSNQKVTIIHGLKKYPNPLATAKTVNKVAQNHGKPANVPLGMTITPVNHISNHSNLNPPKPTSTNPATPKPHAATIIPKTNNSVQSSHTRIDAARPTVSASSSSSSLCLSRPVKRIHPVKISDSVTIRDSSIEKSSDSDVLSHDSVANEKPVKKATNDTHRKRSLSQEGCSSPPKRAAIAKSQKPNNPLTPEFQQLIEVCKRAKIPETGEGDMKKIVNKMVKYYHHAHREYVSSKEFRAFVENVTHHVEKQPTEMFWKLIDLMQEMRQRRVTETNGTSIAVATTSDATATTTMTTAAAAQAVPADADSKEQAREAKRERKIKNLNEALLSCKQKIQEYERAEVDWDDEGNSKYIVTEKIKERAYKIYLKLCDLTGESRSAERAVKKPIKFDGTKFKEFNKKLEKFVNEQKIFPDMFDVLRIIDYCNTKYKYRLDKGDQQLIGECFFQCSRMKILCFFLF